MPFIRFEYDHSVAAITTWPDNPIYRGWLDSFFFISSIGQEFLPLLIVSLYSELLLHSSNARSGATAINRLCAGEQTVHFGSSSYQQQQHNRSFGETSCVAKKGIKTRLKNRQKNTQSVPLHFLTTKAAFYAVMISAKFGFLKVLVAIKNQINSNFIQIATSFSCCLLLEEISEEHSCEDWKLRPLIRSDQNLQYFNTSQFNQNLSVVVIRRLCSRCFYFYIFSFNIF